MDDGANQQPPSMKSRKELEFERIYESHKDKIYRLCLGFSGNQSDDLFQEILIKIWNNFEGFKGNSEISTWIYRIAFNTAISFSTKEKKKSQSQIGLNFQMDIPEAENSTKEQEIQIQLLYQAISELSEVDRVILLLYFWKTPPIRP
jgi:RNA polymerase sigma-70 factor (ECF subfamily)